MRSDLFDDNNEIDSKYIYLLLKYAKLYLKDNDREIEIPINMEIKLKSLQKIEDYNDYKCMLAGYTNGMTITSDNMHMSFDPRRELCAFNPQYGYYVAFNELDSVYYYSSIIDKYDLCRWVIDYDNKLKEQQNVDADTTEYSGSDEEDLLNDIEEELK